MRLVIFIVYSNRISLGIDNRYKLCTVYNLELHILVSGRICRALNVQIKGKLAVFTESVENKCSLVNRRACLLCIMVAVFKRNTVGCLFNILKACRRIAEA